MHYSPKKASTKPETPFMAERKMEGNICRHGCWLGSITSSEDIAYFKNAGVLLMTVCLLRSTGLPELKKSFNQTSSRSCNIFCSSLLLFN